MKDFKSYICPNCFKGIKKCEKKIHCHIEFYEKNIIAFVNSDQVTSKITNYESKKADIYYNNFLNWLFKTFNTNEIDFRKNLFKDINFKKNQRVLITGVGNGGDLKFILQNYKKLNLKIYAQDLSFNLILNCSRKFKNKNIFYNLSNATSLPFKNNFFDHVFHFGGINLFGNYKKSIEEMERVVKVGGSVTYGDEGIAPWLRNTIYSDMLIVNNKLWKFKFKFKNISLNAKEVNIRYLLGNCFYLVNYIFDPDYKNKFNYELIHKSPRKGSILSRYLETNNLKNKYVLKNLNKNIY
jgi:ubiquinone/menaquinone biosynthesis C-methylase UbiE